MPPIKETVITSQTPARISSDTLEQTILSDQALLAEKEDAKIKLPKLIKTLEARREKWQARSFDPTNKFVSRDLAEERRVVKQIKEKEMHLRDLDPQIEVVEKRIKANEEEYKKAIEREGKQRAVSGRKADPTKPKRDAVASPARITKSNARPSHYPSPLRKARLARAPKPGQRFQVSDNKFSRAISKEKDKNAALASKSNKQSAATRSGDKAKPLTKASLTTKQHLTSEKQSSGAASKNPPPSCATKLRADKRSAPDDEDDDDDDLPHKGYGRHLKKVKLNDANNLSGRAAPPSATTSRSNSAKKRPAPEHGDDEPPSKRQKANPEGKESKSGMAPKRNASSDRNRTENRKRPSGLVRYKNACFSNAYIQLFDTACDGQNINNILGKPSAVELLDVSPRSHTTRRSGKKPEARDMIEEAVRNGEVAKVSPAKHFRRLIGKMHETDPANGKTKNHVSPWMFQQVFAWGALETAQTQSELLTIRQEMSGKAQADCLEYHQQVLTVLSEDDQLKAEEKKNLSDLFEVQTYSKEICSNEECTYESSLKLEGISNYHNVNIPGAGPHTLGDLYEQSIAKNTSNFCSQCLSGKIQTQFVFNEIGDSLVMHINRFDHEQDSGSSKIMTDVQIDIDHINPRNREKYELAAVICHSGTDWDFGHYTICRKYKGKWFHIDDDKCKEIKSGDVANAEKYGQSTMILWKKVAA